MARPGFRKRSSAITLVLAGSFAGVVGGTLGGCDGGSPVPQRDAYRNLDDCVRDWKDPKECEPVRDGRYASSYYYGPHYFGSSYGNGRPRPSAHAMSADHTPHAAGRVSRGGFGSSARSFSSGG